MAIATKLKTQWAKTRQPSGGGGGSLNSYPFAAYLTIVRDALRGRRLVLNAPKGIIEMNKPALWYPEAKVVAPALSTLGAYALGWPRGAIVHYTAGNYGMAAIDIAHQFKYTYLVIDETGLVHQGFPLDRWGSHAGQSSWPGLGTKGVSIHLVGIEIECAGILHLDPKTGDHLTWYGKKIPADQVRVVPKQANQAAGAYHIYTAAQEASLTKLLLWLKTQKPEVFSMDLVLGHDEVAPARKTDPGGSLSSTMPDFRSKLKSLYQLQSAAAGKPSV